jgi:hypothetical protein
MTDNPQPDTTTQVAQTTQDAPSAPRRTDHDWEYYYLPSAPVQRLAPHSSQNLISLYKLDDLMKSVRRTDPVTGEKINKLRKSYEGKVKTLHIAGVNKPVSSPGEFVAMGGKPVSEVPEGRGILDYAQGEWLATKLSGRPIQAASSEDLQAKLDKALQMRPGTILEADKWKKIIGNDEIPKAKPSFDGTKGAVTQANTARNSPLLKASGSVRPERTGAKRRYTDQTYSGYGEGLSDDVGDSTHEEERKSAHISKKRRKVKTKAFFVINYEEADPRTSKRVRSQSFTWHLGLSHLASISLAAAE